MYEAETGFGVPAFQRWHREEMDFLSTATRKEPDGLTLKVSYVEALENFFAIGFYIYIFLDLHCLMTPCSVQGAIRNREEED